MRTIQYIQPYQDMDKSSWPTAWNLPDCWLSTERSGVWDSIQMPSIFALYHINTGSSIPIDCHHINTYVLYGYWLDMYQYVHNLFSQTTFSIELTSGKSGTTGLEVCVHYNSNEIGIPELSDIHQENLIGVSFEEDDRDFDGHLETDKFILLALASTSGDWAAASPVLSSRLTAGQLCQQRANYDSLWLIRLQVIVRSSMCKK